MEDQKNLPLTSEEVQILREKLIGEYSKKKGWDSKNLTTIQMLEIVNSREYKNPGLILG